MQPIAPSRLRLWPAALLLLALQPAELTPPPVRVATYNIRRFGVEPTDLDRLVALLRAVDADVIAVQEIQDAEKLLKVAERLSGRGRRYAAELSTCGGKSEMHVGFVWDTARLRLLGTREFPELEREGGRCSAGERPGLWAQFEHARGRLALLTIHLTAGGDADHAAKRREQWRRAFALAAEVGPAVILGDTNSTGWLDNRHDERRFIAGEAEARGMAILTEPLACSEYFRSSDGVLRPSLLDHVVAVRGVGRSGSARVHGYCVELSCRPTEGADPPEFATVSDHCPVTFEVD